MMYVGRDWLSADDLAILQKMAKNKELTSFGHLSEELHRIIPRYLEYASAKGDAWGLSKPLGISSVLSDALKLHYKNRIKDLSFITDILDSRIDACPLCGSTLPATEVDHVIPKESYPEFSCFSLNLVAACDCNGGKGVTFKGSAKPERVLHPYFDAILSERLVYISLANGITKPDMSVEIVSLYSSNKTVKFHVDNILKKTKCLKNAENMWGVFSDSPGLQLIIPVFARQKMSKVEFKQTIEMAIQANDKAHGTPNNWRSMFYYGVLQSPPHFDVAYAQLQAGY